MVPRINSLKPKFKLARITAAAVFIFGGMLFGSCREKETSKHLAADSITPGTQSQTQWKADSAHKADSVLQRNLKCEE
jgi:hypothetical protein